MERDKCYRKESILPFRQILLAVIIFFSINPPTINCRHRAISKVNLPAAQTSELSQRLAKNVPRADPKKYYPIGHPWQNPTVFVDGGITIILGEQSIRQDTNSNQLATDLVGLPATAWPLGRVVVYAQSGRVPVWLEGHPEPKEESYKIAGKTTEVLKALDIDIVYAPIN
jgi:hypothetical protein